jgi:hypothetical protein
MKFTIGHSHFEIGPKLRNALCTIGILVVAIASVIWAGSDTDFWIRLSCKGIGVAIGYWIIKSYKNRNKPN